MVDRRAILAVRIADAVDPIHALARMTMTTTAPRPAVRLRVEDALVRQYRRLRPRAEVRRPVAVPNVRCTRKTLPRAVRAIPAAPHMVAVHHRAMRAVHRPVAAECLPTIAAARLGATDYGRTIRHAAGDPRWAIHVAGRPAHA
jgi:hypothetical protein